MTFGNVILVAWLWLLTWLDISESSLIHEWHDFFCLLDPNYSDEGLSHTVIITTISCTTSGSASVSHFRGQDIQSFNVEEWFVLRLLCPLPSTRCHNVAQHFVKLWWKTFTYSKTQCRAGLETSRQPPTAAKWIDFSFVSTVSSSSRNTVLPSYWSLGLCDWCLKVKKGLY